MAGGIAGSRVGQRLLYALAALVMFAVDSAVASLVAFSEVSRAEKVILEKVVPATITADKISTSVDRAFVELSGARSLPDANALRALKVFVARELFSVSEISEELGGSLPTHDEQVILLQIVGDASANAE